MQSRPQGADALLQVLRGSLEDRYEFQEQIGRGAYSLVFRVKNRALQRVEALKVFIRILDEEASARFFRETRLAARLDHPNIVKIFNFGQAQGIPWYTMQLVDGSSLAEFVRHNGPLDAQLFLRLAEPILDAMAYSHQQGIIHRDIKPQNILVDRFLRPYVADFGLAKALEEPGMTSTGAVLGTPGFLAPEVLVGSPASFAADIYALGATFYQVLAGRLPFAGHESLELLMACLRQEPTPLSVHRPDLPEGLAEVVMRALARDPQKRFASVAEMRAMLSLAADGAQLLPGDHQARELVSDVPTAATRVPQKSRSASSRETLALAAGAAAVLLAVLVLWSPWRAFRPGEDTRVKRAGHDAPGETRVVPTPVFDAAIASPSPTPETTPPRPVLTTTPTSPQPPVPLARPPVADRELLIPPGVSVPEGCAAAAIPFTVRVGRDGTLLALRPLGQAPPACVAAAAELLRTVHWIPAVNVRGEAVEATFATEVRFSSGGPLSERREDAP